MTSAIDPLVPATGSPAIKADFRANFAAAKSEIEALQAGSGGGNIPSILDLGAVGNSNGTTGNGTDDTAAIQAAMNSYGIVFVPQGHKFRITSSLIIPMDGGLIGAGMGVSTIFADAVTGPAIRFAPATAVDEADLRYRQRLENLEISGTCDVGVLIGFALFASVRNVSVAATVTADAFQFRWTFGSTFDTLCANFAHIPRGPGYGGGTPEFTGAAFRIGDVYNANYACNWYCGGGSAPYYGVYFDQNYFTAGLSTGNTFSTLCLQNCRYGLYLRICAGITVNALYTESVATPLRLGDDDDAGEQVRGIMINGGVLYGPDPAGVYYPDRTASIELAAAHGVAIAGVFMPDVAGSIDAIHYRKCSKVTVMGCHIQAGDYAQISTYTKKMAGASSAASVTIFESNLSSQADQLVMKGKSYDYKHWLFTVNGSTGLWESVAWTPADV